MSDLSFLDRRGFQGDPFASTNSESEDNLEEYFVPPPYFETVMGSPLTPASSLIFAPQGSGKTAQRLMIERKSKSPQSNFLCVTYTDFTLVGKKGSLEEHLAAICKLVTIAILMQFEDDEYDASLLSEHQKQVLKYCYSRFVSNLNQQEYASAIGSVKSLRDKAADFLSKHGALIAAGISIAMRKAGLDDVAVPTELKGNTSGRASSSKYLFEQLVSIVRSLYWDALYVLVDKVDEAEGVSGKPQAAYAVIESLLTHLPTLETPSVAFKFFLWDQTETYFADSGGRRDRVGAANLTWTVTELSKMLTARLRAYSTGAVTSFNQLLKDGSTLDAHLLLCYLSNGSPRDLIRMAREIVSEHTRGYDSAMDIGDNTVYLGAWQYSLARSKELYGKHFSDLQRITSPTFTTSKLASDVFKIKVDAVRPKVEAWTQLGAVARVGEESQTGGRPAYLFTVSDVRLALAAATAANVPLILGNYCIQCDLCMRIVVTSERESSCSNCGGTVSLEASQSLMDICTV